MSLTLDLSLNISLTAVSVANSRCSLRSTDTGLHSAKNKNQTWRARFLLLWSSCLEQSTSDVYDVTGRNTFKKRTKSVHFRLRHVHAVCDKQAAYCCRCSVVCVSVCWSHG